MVTIGVRMVRDNHAELRQEGYVGTHNPPANHIMNANATNQLIRHRESAAQNLKEAREKLATDAQPSRMTTSHDLAYLLARLAEFEGQLFVLTEVVRLIEDGKADQLNDWLMMHATRGAEDSWSGRTNDVARSRFDGVLAAIRKVSETIAAFANS
jgi:hypothetical protein